MGCGRVGFDARGDAPNAPDDAAGSGRCGGIDLLADTFTASTPSKQWFTYANGGITLVQTGGQLVITLPPTTDTVSDYGGGESAIRYDARGQRIRVEVPQTVSTATTAQTDIQLLSPQRDAVTIIEESGQLVASQTLGGTMTTLAMTPYDAVAQRWWAFREDAGTLTFETSPDGVAFTPFHAVAAPPFLPVASFVIESGTFESVTSGGSARFDNVNGGTPSGSYCTASTLRDDFSAGQIGDAWAGAYRSGPCTYREAGGQVTFSLTTAAGQECALRSAAAYDLTNDAVFAELVAAPAATGVYTLLRASVLGGDAVEVAVSGTVLECGQLVGGTYTTSCSLPYDPGADRFVRLRGAGTMIAWETSPDGMTWTTHATATSPFPLDAVLLSIGAGTNTAIATPADATFGTFDVLPP